MTGERPDPGRSLPGGRGIALIALMALIALGALAFVFNPGLVSDFFELIKQWIAAAGPFGGLVVVLLAILHSVVFFPMELLAIAAGVAYGFWWGALYMWVGSMAAAAICFALARRLGRPFVVRWLKPDQAEKLDGWIEKAGPSTLLVSRLLPIVSFNLINYGAGLTPVSWWTFLWTTAIGILPVLLLSVFFGTAMAGIPTSWLIGLTAAALLLWLAWHLIKRRGARSSSS